MEKRCVFAPNGPPAQGPYSHAVAVGHLLFVSGQGPFDPATGAFVTFWETASTIGVGSCLWSGPSIHDLDDDAVPEVIFGGSVFDGMTGAARDESLGLSRAGATPRLRCAEMRRSSRGFREV